MTAAEPSRARTAIHRRRRSKETRAQRFEKDSFAYSRTVFVADVALVGGLAGVDRGDHGRRWWHADCLRTRRPLQGARGSTGNNIVDRPTGQWLACRLWCYARKFRDGSIEVTQDNPDA